nr:hypothetical protein [Ganoderma sinense]
MNNVLNYYLSKIITVSIGERGTRGSNNIIFILTTSIGIISKIRDKYVIYNQGKTIDSLTEDVKEKTILIEIQNKSNNDNINTIDELIKYPNNQEILQQSKEFKEQMVVYQQNKTRVLDLENTKSTLIDEGENIRRSLDNGEEISEETITNYTTTVEETAKSIADELQSLNDYLNGFKDYVYKILGNNNFLGDTLNFLPNSVEMDMFVNYGGLILIIWNLFAILCTLSGNILFDHLNGKSELLDKFISYRRKITKHLLLLDIFFTIIIIILIAIYNFV